MQAKAAATSRTTVDPIDRARATLFGPTRTDDRRRIDGALYVLLGIAEAGGTPAMRAWTVLQKAFNQNLVRSTKDWRRYSALKRNPPRMRRERTPEERDAQRRRHEQNLAQRAADSRSRLIRKD